MKKAIWFLLVCNEMESARRHCKNKPVVFCYICGEYTIVPNRNPVTVAVDAAVNYTEFEKCVTVHGRYCIENYYGSTNPVLVENEDEIPTVTTAGSVPVDLADYCWALIYFLNCTKEVCGYLPRETLEDFDDPVYRCNLDHLRENITTTTSFGIKISFSLMIFSICIFSIICFV